MRRKRITEYLALFFAALTALSFAGCAWIGDALHDATKTTDAPRAETGEPSIVPTEAAPADSVSAVFSDYFKALQEASAGLTEAVCEEGGEEKTRLYLEFLKTEAQFAKVYSALSYLTRQSGSLEPEGEEPIGEGKLSMGSFSFRFTTGETLTGAVIDGTTLLCTYMADGKTTELRLLKAGGSYVGWSESGGNIEVFELRKGLKYAFGKSSLFDGKTKFGPEFPAADGASSMIWQDGVLSFGSGANN